MSGNANIKFHTAKASPAEIILKKKYDHMVGMREDMNRKQPTAEDVEKHYAKQRKLAR